MEKLKKQNGITLIALIVTIIVMLILAGVSIKLINGENGFLTLSKEIENNVIQEANEGQEKLNALITNGYIEDGTENLEDEEGPTINSMEIINITNNSFTVKVNVTETRSGLEKIEYSINDGETYVSSEQDARAKEYTFEKLNVGTYNVRVKATDVKGNSSEESQTVEIRISNVDGVPIPVGFYYVGGTKDSGLVISDNSDDENKYEYQTTVGTDLEGNQFVWIPVASIADYKRTAYSTNVATGTTDSTTNSEQIKYSSSDDYYFTEAMPEDERISVETYHGFYIGRYEAGDKESTEATTPTMRASGASTTNTITLKKGQAPYNYVTKTQAQSLAEGMKAKQGYSATTKLCSSYAWDTAIAFMQKTNSDCGNSSEEGNYKNVPDFSYKDITGANQTKSQNGSVLIPTGQTTPVCNIYDMGGNCWEWTTELCSSSSSPCTVRGGGYYNDYADIPAGYRIFSSDAAYGVTSFRPTLFM